MSRLILLSDVLSTLDRGVVSLRIEQENLSAEELAGAIRAASSEGRLVAVLRTEDERTTSVLWDCLIGTKASCDFVFDLKELATGDEVIACPAPLEEKLRWSRFHVTAIFPPKLPTGDYDGFDVGHGGTPGDTESPD